MKISQFFVIFASFLISAHCAEISAKPKALATENTRVEIEGTVFNGNSANLGQFPYQAALSLVDFNGNVYVCGGSLIRYNWVLSIAYCTEASWPSIYVALGTLNMIDGPFTWRSPDIPAIHRSVHPGFDRSNFWNNIGLLYMATATESLLAYEYIDVIPLPLRSDAGNNFSGSLGLFAGYGLTDNGRIGVLYYTVMTFAEQSLCANFFGNITRARNLCADTSNLRSPCGGDTGSGIVTVADGRTFIAGVYSFSPQSCNTGIPAVFEDIAGHRDWIDSVLDGFDFNVTTSYPTAPPSSASMAKLSFGSLIAFAAFFIARMY